MFKEKHKDREKERKKINKLTTTARKIQINYIYLYN
jgi:hypothetical protein